MAASRPTLVKAPSVDESKAPIENALELTDLSIIGPVSCLLLLNTCTVVQFHNKLIVACKADEVTQ
jgi:hypothetical protein